jgi:hypothetical protein
VNRANNNVNVTYTYATSNATVARVAATGVVTAVAPGISTITVTAVGSGTGTAQTTLTSAATVTVSALPTGITALTVSPASLALATGAKARVVASVQQPTGAARARLIYGTTEPTIATVDSLGTVTGIAAGTAVITVTATSDSSAAFAAATLSQSVVVAVSPPAQVAITGITAGSTNNPIAINNVAGQIQVNLAIQPNGQTISAANLWVCEQGETVAACAARPGTLAAQQAFAGAGALASNIQLFVNTAEFDTPNFSTGEDANNRYDNGLKTLVATLTTTPASQSTAAASNSISAINFNNTDGWTIEWTQPTNEQQDANGISWFGGPTTPDPLTPNATSGRSTFTVVPVVYTPNRTITQVTLGVNGLTCGRDLQDNLSENFEPIVDRSRPFSGSIGVQSRDTLTGAFNCEGAASAVTSGVVPQVRAAIDNFNQAYGPTATPGADAGGTGGTPAPQTQIYASFTTLGQGAAGRYLQSLAFQRDTRYIAMDYQAPAVARYDVKGGGSRAVGASAWNDSAWVNTRYAFAGGFARIDTTVPTAAGNVTLPAGSPLKLAVTDGGVGLLGVGRSTSARNTRFRVCNMPSPLPALVAPFDTVRVECTSPVVEATIAQTVGDVNLGERAGDLTNTAYYVQVVETDRLGNRGRSNPFPSRRRLPDNTFQNVDATPAFNEPGVVANRLSAQAFGVDVTPPVFATIPNPSATEDPTNPSIAGVRSGIDSIFTSGSSTFVGPTGVASIDAATARFGVRVSDTRSGFASCTAGVTCPTTSADSARIGTFQITRRRAPAGVIASNAATVEMLIDTARATFRTAMSGTITPGNLTSRDFAVSIWGGLNGNTGRAMPNLPVGLAVTQAGYYTFSAVAEDRAGNTTTTAFTRNVLIDQTAPTITSVQAPFTYTGGAASALIVQATDDTEIMGAEVRVRFPNLTGDLTFPRVPYMVSAARSGIFQNPFAHLASASAPMAYATGPGQFFGGSVSLPIRFIQDLQIASPAVAQPGLGAAVKPSAIGARVMDAKALAAPTGGTTPSSLPNSTSAWRDVDISAAQVSNTQLRKNWGAPEAVVVGGQNTTNPGANLAEWSVYNSGTATNPLVEFRARATSSQTNEPFTEVFVVVKRHNTITNQYDAGYEYRGTATLAGVVDEGGQRYFRYTAGATTSLGALAQGNNVSYPAFGGLDSIRAIGVDASGNGLATPAALPGTTTVPRVITGLTPSAVNIFAPTAAPATAANYIATGGWWSRTNATTQVTSALSILTDERRWIGRDNALATARIYATIALPAGVLPTSGANTTVTCTSNSADVVVVDQGVSVLQSTAGTNTVSQAFCDVRGTAASGFATVTITAARAAEGPYAAATAANTFVTTNLFSGDPTITALGGNSVANLNGAAGWVNQPGSTATPSARQNTFQIAAPTFAGAFNATNTTMSYQMNWTATAAGVSISDITINPLTGAANVTVLCSGGATGAVAAGRTFSIEPVGRAYSNNGFSAPRNGTTIAGTCQ